ncbi:MAG: histone deacetylase [Candidatus Wallbacteria bacterium]|nr:histone deacetylase [Candidatus Wallbacteria bacterium]
MAFYYSSRFLDHHPGRGHPEESDRLEAVLAQLPQLPLTRIEPEPAPRSQLLAVHSEAHLVGLEAVHARGGGALDADTVMSAGSWPAALLAAGAAAGAVERVLAPAGPRRAFCAVRPPGHHATRESAMGFCLLNNVAVAAARALALGLSRVAIVDFDVHHGNGTQDIFYEEGRVLYISTHQYPYYPGTGAPTQTGSGAGAGKTLNLPLPAGTADAAYREVLKRALLPALEDFAPELLLLSAGFDAHEADPLGGLALTTSMFGELTGALVGVAERYSAGAIVSCLEGGYDRPALGACVAAHLAALGGAG